jgi:hypothetical protein
MIMDAKKLQKCVPPALPSAFSGGRKEPDLDNCNAKFSEVRSLLLSAQLPKVASLIHFDKEYLAALLLCTKDSEPEVREFAAIEIEFAINTKHDMREAFPALASMLADSEPDVRRKAAGALNSAAEAGFDISVASSALDDALKEESNAHRWELLELVSMAVIRSSGKPERINLAVSKISECFGGEIVLFGSGTAIGLASKQGADIGAPVSALCELLFCTDSSDVRDRAASELSRAISASDASEAKRLVRKLSTRVHGEDFTSEAEANSERFNAVNGKLDGILSRLRKRMDDAA